VLAIDLGHLALRGFGRWSVAVKESGEMIGGCGLWHPEGYPRSELTWWILPAMRRSGYAFEASRAAVRFSYATLGWPLVETHMNDDNEPARQLALKLRGEVIAREIFPDGLARSVYRLPDPGAR
jgi:RimJ/RimL family protein N-acetyltransferase